MYLCTCGSSKKTLQFGNLVFLEEQKMKVDMKVNMIDFACEWFLFCIKEISCSPSWPCGIWFQNDFASIPAF